MLNSVIFNTTKNDYEKTPMFLGQPRGLVDTINRQYIKQNELYEKLRGQDWTEKEFVFEKCKVEFKTVDPIIANDMIKTLAWQWETDSVASSTIAGIMSCVCSSTEIWGGYQRISDNEQIHARTYAEIVRQSFDDPISALEKFKSDDDAHARLQLVGEVFSEAFVTAHKWALYQFNPKVYALTDKEIYDTYDKIFLYVVALLIMERVQFMPSFAVTFGICELNMFQPIGDAVQRIAQDEIEIHVPYGKANIECMLQTQRGLEAFKNNRSLIIEMLNEVVKGEDKWVDVMHEDGHELVGAPPTSLKAFNYFCATDVASFLGIEKEISFPMVGKNPLPYMDKRVNLSSTQASPQEAPPTSYMVNALTKDDDGVEFDLDL